MITQPISSHIVLGQPHVLGNEGTLAVSWDMSGTCPGHFHLRRKVDVTKMTSFCIRTAFGDVICHININTSPLLIRFCAEKKVREWKSLRFFCEVVRCEVSKGQL
jgi:hypothetical protein